jgi:tetratricopeptide (TPR) repeat protein
LAFRILALVGIPLFLLALFEGALRLAGFGVPTAMFLEWRAGSTNLCVDNPRFGRRFFPPALATEPRGFAFEPIKGTGTLRIFVLGESAALGDPDPKFGFAAMLKALLRARYPLRRYEVVNLSMVAINSHVIRTIALECARRQGDAWVIYAGNNEVIGPFGSATVFGPQAPPLMWVRANVALRTTRVGQFLEHLGRRLRGVDLVRPEWRGMEMFIEQKVRRDDPRTSRVYEHYRRNLDDIVDAGRRAGVRLLLCTVATNLKDCPPFASLHRPGLTDAQMAEWREAYGRGTNAEAQSRWAEALAAYRQAATTDADYAELQYRMGLCYWSLGQQELARRCFEKARDEDALQFRTDSRMNGIIRQTAAAHSAWGVSLVDIDDVFVRRSAHGVPGRELFYEHVHLTPEGNYLIARSLAEEIARVFNLKPEKDGPPAGSRENVPVHAGASTWGQGERTESDWLSLADCLKELGFVEWNEYNCLSEMLKRLDRPPFTAQPGHAARVKSFQEDIDRLRPAIKPAQLRRAIPRLREAVSRHPQDADLRRNLAGVLELVSDFAGAEAEWRTITGLLPHSASAYFNLATMIDRQGRTDEAVAYFSECVKRDSEYLPAQERLGLVLAMRGRSGEAIPHLEAALCMNPDAIAVRLTLAQALAQQGKLAQAAKHVREVLRLDPSNSEARRLLEATARRR